MNYSFESIRKRRRTRVEFISWVDDTVRSDKKLPACRRRGDTVELFEKNSDVDMTVRVGGGPGVNCRYQS